MDHNVWFIPFKERKDWEERRKRVKGGMKEGGRKV